jgi:hypothetical protein
MKICVNAFNEVLVLALVFICGHLSLAGGVYEAHAAEPAAIHDGCEITVLRTGFWRDWMPIVDRPGSDGGSPLRAKIDFGLDNRSGSQKELSFTADVVDEKGQSYPVRFEAADDTGTGWNGTLEQGKKTIVMVMKDGPYLPAGTKIHAVVTWTDQKGGSVSVKTPAVQIMRTD